MKKRWGTGFVLVLALLFGSMSNVHAATNAEAETLVKKAEGYAGALKWQISVETTGKLLQPDMKLFNQTKDSYNAAAKAVATLSPAKRDELNKRLANNVKLHMDRSMYYIDAITAGKKISTKSIELHNYYLKGSLDENAEKVYHELSFEIRKQAILLYRVYGKSTREAILDLYKTPAEGIKNLYVNPISGKMALEKADQLSTKLDFAGAELLYFEAIGLLEATQSPGLKNALYNQIWDNAYNTERFVESNNEGAILMDVQKLTENSIIATFLTETDWYDVEYIFEENFNYKEPFVGIITFELDGREYHVLMAVEDQDTMNFSVINIIGN
jgi:SbsC C-terminal domain